MPNPPDFLPDTHRRVHDLGVSLRPEIRGVDDPVTSDREYIRNRIRELFDTRGRNEREAPVDMWHEMAFRLGQHGGLLDTYEATPGQGEIEPFREEYRRFREVADGVFRDRAQGGRGDRAAQPATPAPAQPEEDEAATPPAAEPQPQPARQSLWKRWFGRRPRAQEPFVPIAIPQVKLTRPSFRRIKKGRQIIGAAGKHGLKLFGISTDEAPTPKPKEEAPAPAKPEPEKKEKKEEAEEKPKKKAA